MAMERGIVASRLDQIADILEHGKTAHLVEPGDVDALAEGIRCLVEDDHYRKYLGAAARREATEKYSWDAHVQRTLEAFRVIEKR
jgi:putative LPS glycosyltransferase